MYGLLRHYISIVEAKRGDGLSEGVKLRIASFHAARAVVDCILDAKRGTVGIIESAAALRACLKRFIERHKQAYGIQLLKPKHHWLWDIAEKNARPLCARLFPHRAPAPACQGRSRPCAQHPDI